MLSLLDSIKSEKVYIKYLITVVKRQIMMKNKLKSKVSPMSDEWFTVCQGLNICKTSSTAIDTD